MRIAESLYMKGLISYPRVDNTVYPKSLDLKECVRTLKAVPQYAPVCDRLLVQPKLVATRGKQETTTRPSIRQPLQTQETSSLPTGSSTT